MSERFDSRGSRVLVVEDEFLLAEELRCVLEQAGFVVVGPVATLEGALALVRDASIDAAVLDVRIVGGDSGPVAEALVARGCPVLFATGYGPQDLPPGQWQAPIVTKPLVHAELLGHLDRLIRARTAGRS